MAESAIPAKRVGADPDHGMDCATPEHFRRALAAADEALDHDYRNGVPAHVLVHRRAEVTDRLLISTWRTVAGDRLDGAALVAVGGYGRGELHPASDIDLLVLLPGEPDGSVEEAVGEFFTFLWDSGVRIGHGVRTVDQCVEEAERDITVATSLMESRLLVGEPSLFERMRAQTAQDRIWPSRAFFEAKLAEQIERHHRYHEAAYNLEPNVKEGPGGLRDIQMIGWVAKRHFGADELHELVTHDFLTESEFRELSEGQDFLWAVRFALHRLSGRCEDRLLFDYQRRLAERFGYHDDDRNLAVEKFMKRYYRTIMGLSRLNEMLLELFQEAILMADVPLRVEPINRRFRSVNGFLDVTSEDVFQRWPFALLELFLVLQQHPEMLGVRASTIRLVRDHRYLIDDRFRNDIRACSLFREMLRQPRGVTHELRRMHRYGVLGAYLPAFGAVSGQMQYDLFHAYTVDEHSLFVVSNLRAFAIPERRHEFPLCSEIFTLLPKPDLLYVAGLFHDIGKGRGADHSELGAGLALEFCRRHDFGEYDTRLVVWLVRHHLLMSITAQRRDITDPDVVNAFAASIGDHTHLDYLYLLTVADICGTNPTLWNDWKATLLRDLYFATLRALRRGLENPIDRAELIEETQNEAARLLEEKALLEQASALWASLGDDYFLRHTADEIAWHTRAILHARVLDLPLVLARAGRGGTEVFVYAPDQKYLFATTTSVLGRLGLTILDARIITADNGMTLDSYVVLGVEGGANLEPSRAAELRSLLREALKAPGRTRLRIDSRRRRRQLKHFDAPTSVSFHTDERNRRTVMEVYAVDRPGLLARIGWALADAEARLQNAKIATFGERAEDVFYITDAHNEPLVPDRHEALRERIVAAIDTLADAVPEPAGRG